VHYVEIIGRKSQVSCDVNNAQHSINTYLSFVAYSCSIFDLWSTKFPYFSRKSMPFCVWAAILSY
jgi:hypothetical protein